MKTKYTFRTGVTEGLVILFAVLYMVPIYVAVVAAFKSPSETAANPLSLPSSLRFDNFVQAWTQADMGQAFTTSVLITIASSVLIVAAGSLASFVIGRRTGRISNGVYVAFLMGIILPFQLGSITLYQLMRNAQLLGNPLSLILFYLGSQMPLTIFIYTGFLRAIPRDYEEAALLDGAGQIRSFLFVVFPLLRPVTSTVIILNAVAVWNDFFTPLIYLTGSSRQTLPVAIYSFVGQYTTSWNLIFAGVVISAIPVVAVFFALQRAFLKSFGTAIKG
ncbi:MAG: carbohydrate ABC transporter permease [Micrococcales bacterium]|nr:carbohydrate ABC transporter permease [Micrococcales bacterium]